MMRSTSGWTLMIIRSENQLTPVEKVNWYLTLKRDDLFMPFDDIPLSGGKVRQTLALIRNNLAKIRKEHDSTVITATSIESPQGVIVARCAYEFGLKSVICFGGTSEKKIKSKTMYHDIEKYNATIDTKCGIGFDSAIQGRIHKLLETDPYFNIKFGINLENDPQAILGAISDQCQNIPNGLSSVVIPVGSAITMAGILLGLQKYNKMPAIVYGIQIAGYDRTDTIDRIVNSIPYTFIKYDRFPYSQHVKIVVGDTLLDPVYEAKAYNWLWGHRQSIGDNCLFWIVGNSSEVRTRKQI